jgi:purine nucleosidase
MITAPLLVDCDTGIDDSAALVYLLVRGANVVAVTSSHGNTSAHQSALNSSALLRVAGRTDITVAVGSENRFDGSLPTYSPEVHGETGTGNVRLDGGTLSVEPGVDAIVRLARQYPGELQVLVTGALTNIARALALEPELPKLVHTLTVMGGAALVPGNVTPVAEANIESDPEAAATVFASELRIVLVPLDVTMDHVLENADRLQLEHSPQPAARLVGQMLDSYMDFYVATYGRKCAPVHDALAAAIALGDVELEDAPFASVAVDSTDGPGRGQTLVDLRNRFTDFVPPTGTTRVVLRTAEPFVPKLVEALASA